MPADGGGELIVVAAVALLDEHGRMLTVRKRGTQRFMNPGGKLEPGESPLQAAVREIDEELGVTLDPARVVALGEWSAAAANEPGATVRAHAFRAVLPAGCAPAARAEIDEIRWVSPAQAAREPDSYAPLLVERFVPALQAPMIEIAVESPSEPAARSCLRAYAAEMAERLGGAFAGGGDDHLVAPSGLLLVATLDGEPVGCGGLVLHAGHPPEIKRLWTAPAARGMGLARRLLHELEARAAAAGSERVQLDTARSLTEAIALYRSSGYVEVERYNDNPHAQLWFEKAVSPAEPQAS